MAPIIYMTCRAVAWLRVFTPKKNSSLFRDLVLIVMTALVMAGVQAAKVPCGSSAVMIGTLLVSLIVNYKQTTWKNKAGLPLLIGMEMIMAGLNALALPMQPAVSLEIVLLAGWDLSGSGKSLMRVLILLTGFELAVMVRPELCHPAVQAFILVLLLSLHTAEQTRFEQEDIVMQSQLMKKQAEEVESIYLTMRGWRHDYHNHLQSLKAYLAVGQTAKIGEYLNELEQDLDRVDTTIQSGNTMVNAILNAKITYAENSQIPVTCKAQVPERLKVSDLDLCVVLGNLIDNAVDANLTLEPEKRFLRIYIGIFKQQLYINVTNAASDNLKKQEFTLLSTKTGNHGHGIRRMNAVIELYDGWCSRQFEPGVFATEILLPL